jgi:hypothetical protein
LAHSWEPASPAPSTSPPYRTLARRASILDHEDYGAIVAGTSGLSVLTASAASPAVAQLMKNLANALQATRHTPVPADDVRPLPAHDPAGTGLAASAFPWSSAAGSPLLS